MTESRRDGGAGDGDSGRADAAAGITAPSLPTGGGAVRGIGTMLEQHNVRCGFRQITRAVGLCDE